MTQRVIFEGALDAAATNGLCTKTLQHSKVALLWSASCCLALKEALTCLTYQLVAALALVLRINLAQLRTALGVRSNAIDAWKPHPIEPHGSSTSLELGAHPTFRLSAELSRAAPGVVYSWQPALLLPPRLPQHHGRLTVVLDLDETLVCAYRESSLPLALRSPAARAANGAFQVPYTSGASGLGDVVVFRRPGLAEFLHRASALAELVVFTAGLPSYAAPLLDVLDPEGTLFAARLYREATVRSPCGRQHVKDLARLGRSLDRTLLVDNNPYSFLAQPENGVPVGSFKGDPADGQLLGALLPLLEALREAPDVRPHLIEWFGVAEWLAARAGEVAVGLRAPHTRRRSGGGRA